MRAPGHSDCCDVRSESELLERCWMQRRIQLIRIKKKKERCNQYHPRLRATWLHRQRHSIVSKTQPKDWLTTNVTVSGQPPAPPAPSSSTMCTESADGQPPPQSSQIAGGQPPPQSSSTMCTQSAGAQPLARPRLRRLELPFRQVLKVHI